MSDEKSTNVRISTEAPRKARHRSILLGGEKKAPAEPRSRVLAALLRVIGAISTELAASIAEYLFFRSPKRRGATVRERAVLDTGTHRRVRYGDELLSTWTFGQGPRVVLVHGWGGNAAQLTPIVDPLVAAGFSVVAFDAPGHGDSTGKTSTLRDFATSIREIAQLDDVPLHAVVAHSFGSAGTMLAVSDGLNLGRAVFIAPPSDPRPWFDIFSRYLALTPRVKDRARERIEDYLGARMDEVTASALGPHFRQPLLVIHDRQDREVPWTVGETVADSVPSGAIVSTEGLGHKRILHDEKVIERTVRFAIGDRDGLPCKVGCRSCSAPVALREELCERCALAEELFDRRKRWAQLTAA